MKRFVLFCFVYNNNAQNLVPNPSFENYNNCSNATINSADYWCTAANQVSNCTYLNPCMSYSYAQAPRQYLDNCFQSYQTVRTGIAYAEFAMSVSSSQQDGSRPMVKLIDTLETGKIYCVTYYISRWNNAKYSFDKLGALLTPTPFPCSTPGGTVFPTIAGQYTPQVVSTPSVALEDTLNWMEISGSFTAIGDEAYLTLGDFFLQSQHYIKNSGGCNGLAEYYIDDVSVEVVEVAKARNDTLIMQGDSTIIGANNSEAALFSWQPTEGLSCTNCPNPKASPTITTTYTVTKTQCKAVTSDAITVSVSPTGTRDLNYSRVQAKLYPNPNNGTFMLAYDLKSNSDADITIVDVTGKVVFTGSINKLNNIVQINTIHLQSGIYFVQLSKSKALLWTDKLMISK